MTRYQRSKLEELLDYVQLYLRENGINTCGVNRLFPEMMNSGPFNSPKQLRSFLRKLLANGELSKIACIEYHANENWKWRLVTL